MLKYVIDFVNFDGEPDSEVHYFNLTKSELIELDVNKPGGMKAALERIIQAQDPKVIVNEFKELVLLAYGVRSEDGRRFIKNDEVREAFAQTAAYDALFIKLATDADAAAEWLIGVMPADMTEEIKKSLVDTNPIPVPPAPSLPPQ